MTIVLSSMMFSCGTDSEDTPKGAYSNGIFVVNEGVFFGNNASLSFIDTDKNIGIDSVFATENGSPLGDTFQSMEIVDDQAYLVVNVSSKIEVIDRNTGKSISTIQGEFDSPRYFAAINSSKAYVTNWGNAFGVPSTPPMISIVDLKTNAVSGSIEAKSGAEDIVAFADKAFVSNSFIQEISVYDTQTDALVSSIDTAPHSPKQMLLDKNNKLWVITFSFDANFTNTPSGELLRIDPLSGTIEQRISLEAGVVGVKGRLSINQSGDKLYYLFGNGLYELDITATSAPSSPLISGNFYGVGIDGNGNIYCSEADFSIPENNKIKKYSNSGQFMSEYSSGIGANGFAF
jgi:hypothetical protein